MKQGEEAGSEKTAPILLVSWETIEDLTQALASRLVVDGKPDMVVCLQRGGLIPGVLLSHQLAVAEMLTIPIRRTTSDAVYADKQVPVLVLPEQASQLAGKDVVLVDDIVGSGETMQAALSALAVFHPRRLRTVSYLVNLDHWEQAHHSSPEQEMTYIGQTIRAWAIFPWERSARSCMAQEEKQLRTTSVPRVQRAETEHRS